MSENDDIALMAHLMRLAGFSGNYVLVSEMPKCNMCEDTATYDAKTKMGPWAYLCERCFNIFTHGELGTGIGQRLIVKDIIQ